MTRRPNRSPFPLARSSAFAVAAVAMLTVPAVAGADPAPSGGKQPVATRAPSSAATTPSSSPTAGAVTSAGNWAAAAAYNTRTPIKHLVVIIQENRSFDHYFATYPNAANIAGETLEGSGAPAPTWTGSSRTPSRINNLKNANLLTNNPNSKQPFRLKPSQAVTCSQGHTYAAQQKAFNGGAMDKFVEYVSRDVCGAAFGTQGLTMGYYDGNTVTGMWNYAQHFAMSDNFFTTVFGPSTPGALNVVSGQTHGVRSYDPVTRVQTSKPDPRVLTHPDADGVGTMIGDPDPVWDDCTGTTVSVAGMDGKNIGDLLNAKNVTWGWFQGGFKPVLPATDTTRAVCSSWRRNVAGIGHGDYIPHHQPFQYYKSTANPKHLPPTSTSMIGRQDQANHQYDLSDFDKVVNTDYLPAVSFLKANASENGHAYYSSPLDEQRFLVDTINKIQMSPNWKDTAIVIAYDDSDGWYDHKLARITNASNTIDDSAVCTDAVARGVPISGGYVNRCGPGTRVPLLVISPYARSNYVHHAQTDQSSIIRFVEDNWRLNRRIGDHSADARARTISGLFDFRKVRPGRVMLNSSNGALVWSEYPRCHKASTCAATRAKAERAPLELQKGTTSGGPASTE